MDGGPSIRDYIGNCYLRNLEGEGMSILNTIRTHPLLIIAVEQRRKNGMTWYETMIRLNHRSQATNSYCNREDFRKLKEEKEGPGVSEEAMMKYRKQLDAERKSKLSGGKKRSKSDKKKKKKSKHKRRHRHDSSDEDSSDDDSRERSSSSVSTDDGKGASYSPKDVGAYDRDTKVEDDTIVDQHHHDPPTNVILTGIEIVHQNDEMGTMNHHQG